jgi:molecular chaperone GrpE (heat shock protein)
MGNDLESDKQDIIVLQKIYDQLFEMYCLANSECRRLHTQIGEVFDQDNHVLVGSSGAGGEICEVLFDGYKKGEKIRKSLVRVEG